jgi:hypothetical protein
VFKDLDLELVLEFSNNLWGPRNQIGMRLSYRPARAGIFKQSMGARNRIGKGYRIIRQSTQAAGFDSLESILVLLKSLKYRLRGNMQEERLMGGGVGKGGGERPYLAGIDVTLVIIIQYNWGQEPTHSFD